MPLFRWLSSRLAPRPTARPRPCPRRPRFRPRVEELEDRNLLTFTAATLPATALVLNPTASLSVTYSAPYDPATIGADDLKLSQGKVTGVSLVNPPP
jgi:hypothetical protein